MKKLYFYLFALILLFQNQACKTSVKNDQQIPQHRIYAEISKQDSSIRVSDSLFIPVHLWNNLKVEHFDLNKGLSIKNLPENISEVSGIGRFQFNNKPEKKGDNYLVVLNYSGRVYDAIGASAAEYARGFSGSSGIICSEGVFLSGASKWLPAFDSLGLFTFDLNVKTDSAWKIVSQGSQISEKVSKNIREVTITCPYPMDECYLLAGPWTTFEQDFHDVKFFAYLRTPDEELAQRYLSMTGEYLKLYEQMIGPYPFDKFALVENFWETGFGMPTFTLLGSSIIRFPWILYSSYPHELLHNYWGNSVYVDYSEGNWCEGITVYMADHLLKEQQGLGAQYRRETLEKFTNHVNDENDFPVSEFINRNNAAQEAIGYGKVLMINEMLRTMLGDSLFLEAYRDFYKSNKFRYAGFSDIRKSFEKVSGKDLKTFFNQWILRKSAPEIHLVNPEVNETDGLYSIEFTLEQTQKEKPFEISIPIAVYFEGDQDVVRKSIPMAKKAESYKLSFDSKPLRIQIDPQFNVMRKLDASEIPPTLSLMYGQKDAMIILPSQSKALKEWDALANNWKESQEIQGLHLTIVKDSELGELPANKAVWVLGKENKFSISEQGLKAFENQFTPEKFKILQSALNEKSLVLVQSSAGNPEIPMAFIYSSNPKAIAGLSRKLPHYGKYSALAFEGAQATNILKFTLKPLHSAMEFDFDPEANAMINTSLPLRKALAN